MTRAPLLPGGDGEAIRFGDRALAYPELARAAGAVAAALDPGARVAGAAAWPLNPSLGVRELEHVVADSAPAALLAAPGVELPVQVAGLTRIDVDPAASGPPLPPEPPPEAPALVVYTSGTTGAP